jgi:hypothetical protein
LPTRFGNGHSISSCLVDGRLGVSTRHALVVFIALLDSVEDRGDAWIPPGTSSRGVLGGGCWQVQRIPRRRDARNQVFGVGTAVVSCMGKIMLAREGMDSRRRKFHEQLLKAK